MDNSDHSEFVHSKKEVDQTTYSIIGAAIEVHRLIGPGLLESIYHTCLAHEFALREIYFRSQVIAPLLYKGISTTSVMRCDFIVDERVVVEIKAAEAILPVHEAQLLTYMKLLRKPKGILLNFNCSNLWREGQRTMVNELYRELL